MTGWDSACHIEAARPVREELRTLLLRDQKRLHWREESRARRTLIAGTIATVEVSAIVVIGAPLAQAKQERGRRKCLEALLPRPVDLGVSRVWLESRTDCLNREDDEFIRTMRGKRALPRSVRVFTARPGDEPMLWVPDTVAGAVNAACRGDTEWFDAMRSSVEVVEVSL